MPTTDPILSPDARSWLWPDGTTLPVVSGGSDLSTVGETPPADAPPPAEAPADASPADAPPPEAPAAEADDDTFYEGWPEKAVKSHKDLKGENVRYKERFRPFEEAFGDLHEQDRDFMLGFVDAFRTGDAAEVARYAPALRNYLDSLTPADRQEAVEALEGAAGAPKQPGEDEWDPFDPKRVEAMIEEKATSIVEAREEARRAEETKREHAAAVERHKGEIEAAAKSLATEHGVEEWGDPKSGMFRALVSLAADQQGETTLEARMAKAAELLSGELDRRAQALLKAKSAGAGEAPAPQGGTEPSGRQVPRDLDEASESAMRRIASWAEGRPGN